jgi:hypothetical protein
MSLSGNNEESTPVDEQIRVHSTSMSDMDRERVVQELEGLDCCLDVTFIKNEERRRASGYVKKTFFLGFGCT